ncbi:MAG: hypothetical protein JSV88_03660 [Candidatus Aminicenantes bacterium]|nr:MAG: hypothetical protein JSV88_03660 [Candidatus Aminicenantes bacterium]
MAIDKDKLPVLQEVDERLGDFLSAALKEAGDRPDDCPSPEEIAALVEGRISGEKRNKIMKHLSSCDTCYGTFMLAFELQTEAIAPEEIKRKRSNVVIFRPLALAASILIVIISIYLFFKTDVPKTAEEFMDMKTSKEKAEEVQPQPQPTAPLKAPPPSPGISMPKAKKGEPITAGEDRLKALPAEKPARELESPGREDHFKKEEEKPVRAQTTTTRVSREGALDETHEREKTRDKTAAPEQKAAKPLPTPPKKMKAALQTVEKDTIVQKQEKRQAVRDRGALQESSLGSVRTRSRPFEKNIAWSQANLLNEQSQIYKAHIPTKELRDMFQQSIDLTNQLKEPFENLQKEAKKTGDLKKIDAFVQGVTPLITIKSSKDVSHIYPNIGYFLSKSIPGSVEHQFFSLARSGWCEPEGRCYDMERPIESHSRDLRSRMELEKKAAGKKDMGENQLTQWKMLYPQLSGIFRDVAQHTIENLKQQQRILPAER